MYNHTNENVHKLLIEKLDDIQLEGSGFQFQEIEEVILQIYKINDIQASSWVELPPEYKNSQSIINKKNKDQYSFLWCILAYLYPVEDHKDRISKYLMHENKLNLKGLEFPMKVKDIPKFERPNKLNIRGHGINVFGLTGNVLTPIYINENYKQPQIDLMLYKNHYCLITKLHCLINKDSHMKHVCRRCFTAFYFLNNHIERCINPQPTNITFSWKNQLKFEDFYMKVPVPIRVYADFECINQPQKNPKVLFKQIPIAVGYYHISPFGNNYSSYFGLDCKSWFVNEMLTLEKIASKYFKTNLELEITPQEEESFQLAEECWLCEQPFTEGTELRKVRDHDHLTGKYRGAAHNICNINCKQRSSSFVPIFFHNFSGYDCHLIFEELLTQAFEKGYEPKKSPKSMENYVSIQVGCLRFLDSYRFLSLHKLDKSLDNLPVMDENGFIDKLFKKKLAYRYEYFNLDNFDKPLNLTKEDYRSTLTQSYPSDDDIKRTQELIDKNKIKNGREITMLYIKNGCSSIS